MEAVAKRVMDIGIALVALVVLAPVLIAAAMAIKVSSPGPVLFRQRRIGRNGRSFEMYKLRTMVANADPAIHRAYVSALMRGEAGQDGGLFKLASDPRITTVGRFLRRTSIDELPQLFNVVKGDMSLVGPRPPLPYEYELYDERARQRLSVLPGITGLWQVSGRSRLTFRQMIELDLAYVSQRSIWLDLTILLRTPAVLLTGSGAC